MKNLVHDFYNRAVEWLFRVRTLGAQLLKGGVALLLVLLGADFAGRVRFSFGDFTFDIQGSTGSGLPGLIVYTATAFSVLMLILGGVLIWRDERRERRKQLIVVEVRGLHSSPDTPARDKINPAFRGERKYVQVDFRPGHAGELVNPDQMLDSIKGMTLHVKSAAQGRDMSEVSVAIGGVAAVPGMFLIGMRMDDESKVELYDWNRDLKSWKMVDGFDDGNRPRQLVIPSLSGSETDVVLAVSASYRVDEVAVAASFPGFPVVRLEAEKTQANSFWSEAVQQAFAAAFRNAVQELLSRHVKRIHLVLAAPASLTLRLGSTYDERLHPELIVYQYEKSSVPPYPWGVVLPSHGVAEPRISRATQLAS